MDEYMKTKLEELGLKKYTDLFEENEIDKDAFLMMEEETLKELVKPVGPRTKLWKHLQELKKDGSAGPPPKKARSSIDSPKKRDEGREVGIPGDRTKLELSKLSAQLEDVPKKMRLFSLSMRSLYAEKALTSSSSEARKISKLRNEVRQDAMVYLKAVLPVSTEVGRSIKDYFEYYEELGYEEWQENLSDILEEVVGYKQCCTETKRLHEKILTSLKSKEDRGKEYMKELKLLTKKFKEQKAKLEASASSKHNWAFGIAFLPGINLLALPLLKGADKDLAEAVAKGQQCEINESVIVAIAEVMMPALGAFIKGLEGLAGFFSIMEQELTSFRDKGGKAIENAKKLHYRMMKAKAVEINDGCRGFYAMIPGVRTDFECIPENTDDDNYVDRWLKQRKEEIEKAYPKGISANLKKMLGYYTSHTPMLKGGEDGN